MLLYKEIYPLYDTETLEKSFSFIRESTLYMALKHWKSHVIYKGVYIL